MSRNLRACCGLVLLACLVSRLAGEMVTRRWGTPPTGPAAKAAARPRARPPTGYVALAAAAPVIDGKVDEEVWAAASVLRLARTLDGGSRAAQPTEVRLLRDDKTLYLAARCAEPQLDKLRASRRGHDGEIWGDDSIEFFLGLGGAYYHFGVNAVGSTYDAQAKDRSWNSLFKAATGRGRDEWTLEAAVPLTKIAGEGKLPTRWTAGFNRNRYVTGGLQESAWSPTFSGDSHVPERFGTLLFQAPPPPQERQIKPKPVIKGKSLEVLPCQDGAGVVRFDLSELPRPARIYRADVLAFRTAPVTGADEEALVTIEIHPLSSPLLPGARPRAAGKPLALRPPWYDRFDATDAVRQWAADGTGPRTLDLFVKAFPRWNAEATCLDVWYEGRAGNLPPQVKGLAAVHRAGQTFITWREIDDPVGQDQVKWGQLKQILDDIDRKARTRYCVYRHTRRITADNLHQAEPIAQVKPLSCWNVNGRNIDRPVDDYIATADGLMTGHWNPFDRASLDGDFGRDCPIDRLVIRDGEKPLPRGTGLYVHTPGNKGSAYYALVTSIDGVQNSTEIGPGNSLSEPVAEVAGEGEPVLQRAQPAGPIFSYPDRRLHYVRWVAPPHVNVPSQYYNWSVAVPKELGRNVPLELNLHRDGHSYWRTHYRIERDSIVLCPHDFPLKTWWYGYHESCGTLKSFRQGAIHNYTERRLLSFVGWAARKWPVDGSRILVTGCRGGASGSGALRLGLRHPRVFSLVISGHGMIEYASAAQQTDRRALAAARSMQAIWGRTEWEVRTAEGKRFWAEQDMLRLVQELPASAELPFVTLTSAWATAHPFYTAMLSGHRGVIGQFAWGGTRYVPVSRSQTFPNVIHLDVGKDLSHLALSYAKGIEGLGNNSQFNTEFRWRDVIDQPQRYEVTLAGGSRQDVTVVPRRLRKFQVAPGRSYAWKNTLLPGSEVRRPRNPRPNSLAGGGQSGEVTVGQDGLLVLTGVEFSSAGSRLVITPK